MYSREELEDKPKDELIDLIIDQQLDAESNTNNKNITPSEAAGVLAGNPHWSVKELLLPQGYL